MEVIGIISELNEFFFENGLNKSYLSFQLSLLGQLSCKLYAIKGIYNPACTTQALKRYRQIKIRCFTLWIWLTDLKPHRSGYSLQ